MATAPFADIAPGFRVLQRLEVFDFADAEADAEEQLGPFRDAGAQMSTLQRARDFTLLSAAEWALLPALLAPWAHESVRVPIEEPIRVGPENVRAAVATADCGGWDLCLLPPGGGEVHPWHVLLFAGDMHKFTRVSEEQGGSLDDIPGLVAAFRDRYGRSPAPASQQIAERNLAALQGAVWVAKHAMQSNPRELEDRVQSYVDRTHLVAK